VNVFYEYKNVQTTITLLIYLQMTTELYLQNYEPIMRICGKIFVSNLHNLQMLFML